nr:G protein-coupled receptor [Proales similis]
MNNTSRSEFFDAFLIGIEPQIIWTLVLLFANALCLVVGVLGNGFIVYSVACDLALRSSPPFLLILNMCIGQLLFALVVPSSIISSLLFGKQFFLQTRVVCSFSSTLIVWSIISILTTKLAIGLNRFWQLFRPKTYKKVFRLETVIKICCISWLNGLLFNLLKFTDLISGTFDARLGICLLSCKNRIVSLLITSALVYFTMMVNGIIYICIVIEIKRRKRRLRSNRFGLHSDSNRLIKSLLAHYILYLVTWTPLAFVLQQGFILPASFYILLISVLNTHPALTPFLYYFYNYRIRDSIKKTWRS